MQQGAVWWQRDQQIRRLRRGGRELQPGDQLHFYWDPAILASTPAVAKLIVDGGSYSVWNKPATMLSQGTKWGDHCTLTRYAEKQLSPERNAFLIHRLDRAASGLMVVGHSKSATRHLARQFHDRLVNKTYLARVEGEFPDTATPLILNDPISSKPAHSEVALRTYDIATNQSIVRVNISSGRKHQIRIHLANAGWPLIGDRLHGKAGDLPADQPVPPLQLCSWQLSFDDPDSAERLKFNLDDESNYLLDDQSQHHWINSN